MERMLMFAALISLATAPIAMAQQKTLASTMDVFVFPSEGQTSEEQSKDEAECYNWAVGNTGTDPFDIAKQAQEQQAQAQQAQEQAKKSGTGSGARGAARGAAAGAVIGGIANDDAGKGAAYGAAAGVIGGRARGRRQSKEAQKQVEQQSQQSQQATKQQLDNFKKAFSVCLEAKEYMVKF